MHGRCVVALLVSACPWLSNGMTMAGRTSGMRNIVASTTVARTPAPYLAQRSQEVSGGVAAEDSEVNGIDEEYPYRFDGRLWFRPALVRMPTEPLPGDVKPIGIFGWTVGGNVCLEYDESPVGKYVEYVTMGALCTKRGAIGQWGSRLFVSTDPAEEVCRRVWSVPAEVANINFDEGNAGDANDGLRVEQPPKRERPLGVEDAPTPPETIRVSGWADTRINNIGGGAQEGGMAFSGLPVLWTPSIKALWAPLVPLAADRDAEALPLHRLRLSAKSVRLRWCAQSPRDELGVPIPIGLAVDGVRIEIGREEGRTL